MDHRQQYRQAQLDLIDIVADLTDADLDVTSTCTGWTVRDILVHVTGNAYSVVAQAEGREYDADTDDRLRGDLRAEYPRAAEAAWRIIRADAAIAGEVEFAGQQRPRWLTVSFGFADILIHQWDIGRSLQRPVSLRPDAVAEALTITELIPEGDEFRGPGKGFAHIVPTDSTDPQDRLLALSGRNPDWTPAA